MEVILDTSAVVAIMLAEPEYERYEDAEDAALATAAYEHFGKGLSPVGLNLGDCPVHALAQRTNQPVLSTSDEFRQGWLEIRAAALPPD